MKNSVLLRTTGYYMPKADRVMNTIQQGMTPRGSEKGSHHNFNASPDSKQTAADHKMMTCKDNCLIALC